MIRFGRRARTITHYGGELLKKHSSYGSDAWVAQPAKQPTLDFSSGHDLRVVGSSLVLDSVLGEELA